MEYVVIASVIGGVSLVMWLLKLHASPGKSDLARACAGRAVLICAVLSLVLGVVGWWGPSENEITTRGDPNATHIANWTATLVMSTYKAGQHVLLNAEAKPHDDWVLQLSRVFAIVTITLLAIEAISRLFAEPIQRFVLWRLRGHVVICGLGATGSQLVIDAAKRIKKRGSRQGIVVIDRDPDKGLLAMCAGQGAVFVAGDVTDASILEVASAARAERVFFVTGSDEANTEGAHQLRKLVETSRSLPRPWWHRAMTEPPVAHVHVRRAGLAAMLDSRSEKGVMIRGFSVVEEAALEVVQDLVTRLRPRSREQTLHAVIVGFGPMGQALALRLAEFGHFENCRRTRMTIVHEGEEVGKVAKFMAQYPAMFPPVTWGTVDPWRPDPRMDDWAFNTFVLKPGAPTEADRGVAFVVNGGFTAMQGHVRSRDFVDHLVELAGDERVVPLVFVCGDADEDNCTDAKHLHDELEQRLQGAKAGRVHVFSHVAKRDAMAAFATSKGDQAGAACLRMFGLSREVCTFEKLTSTDHIDLARQILASFETTRNEQLRREGKNEVPMTVLETAATWVKRTNLSAAMHAPVKLAVAGMRLVADGEGTARAPEWPEILQEMEHNRWTAERLLTGWRFGKRDDEQMQRLQLVAWRDLPKSEMRKDEEQKRAVMSFCAGRLAVDSRLGDGSVIEASPKVSREVMRVGWVGHRVLAEPEKVRAGIARVWADLAEKARAQSRELHAIGGLAEGADVLCAQAAVANNVQVHLVLLNALSPKTHVAARVLAQAAEVSLVPDRQNPSEQHVALAEYMLARIDVLIAVWDGDAGRGAGGTADVVERAKELNKLVVLVPAQRGADEVRVSLG